MKNDLTPKMRWVIANLVTIILFGVIFTSCNSKQDSESPEEYTCPMHPKVIRDGPGSCPVCKMDLVKKEKPKASSQLSNVELHQVSDLKTVTMKKMTATIPLKSQGVITYDQRQATVVSSRIAGRIEKLYAKYLNQPVSQGQKLFEVYSPELSNAQRELIYLTKNDASNNELIQSAKEKLNLLGVDKNQIQEIIKSGKEKFSFALFSPVSGYIVSEDSNPSREQTEIKVREGNYVEAGETVLKIVSSNQVWAEFDLKQKEATAIKQGLGLQIKTHNRELKATVNLIQPFFKGEEGFLKVRAYLSNSNHQFKIGELVEAEFEISKKESNWLPLTAVVDLGTRKVVYLKKENGFEAREIQTGNTNREWIEIISGLTSTDEVAPHASYITDSESFVKVK